jgi:hypothetical protein
MNNKTSKIYNLQANKNNQMQKRITKFGISTSTTFNDAQPFVVCHLLPFIHRILGFAHSIHPQKET